MSNALIVKFAEKFSVDQSQVLVTLKATCFKGPATDAQITALMIVADQFGLNPWTKEIYAFPDKNNGIVPVVGVDGWARIINEHPAFDGMDFNEGSTGAMPDWIECVIYRKDRSHPIKLKEYMAECKRPVGPWQSHPRRMLRHKAMIQCARLAFGYVGIYDQDEAERIVEVKDIGSGTPESAENWIDVAPMIAAAIATKTDAEALQFWRDHNGKLVKQPNDHKRLKDSISSHRAAMKVSDEVRTVEMPKAETITPAEVDSFVAAMDEGSAQ
jgi:phage recombination protein Bet